MTPVNDGGCHHRRIIGIRRPECEVLAFEIDVLTVLANSRADHDLVTRLGVIDGLLNRRVGLSGRSVLNRLGDHAVSVDVHGVGMNRRTI